jgi:hypothetical protein
MSCTVQCVPKTHVLDEFPLDSFWGESPWLSKWESELKCFFFFRWLISAWRSRRCECLRIQHKIKQTPATDDATARSITSTIHGQFWANQLDSCVPLVTRVLFCSWRTKRFPKATPWIPGQRLKQNNQSVWIRQTQTRTGRRTILDANLYFSDIAREAVKKTGQRQGL